MTSVCFKNLLSRLEGKNLPFSLYDEKGAAINPHDFEDFFLTHFVQHTKDSHGNQTLFAFLPGKTLSLQDFMDQVLQEGVKVVVLQDIHFFQWTKEQKTPPKESCIFLVIPSGSFVKTLGIIGSLFFSHLPPYTIGITGTDGKTSVVHFLHQLWDKMKCPHLTFGTLGIKGFYEEKGNAISLDMNLPNRGCTTPPGSFLNGFLSRHPSVKHMATEASSHALHQQRLLGFPFYLGVFTNFTQDHLDYHKTQKAYGEAKMELFHHHVTHRGLFHFSLLPYFHLQGIYTPYFYGSKELYMSYSKDYHFLSSGSVGYYEILRSKPFGNQVRFSFPFLQESYELFLPLLGEFQVCNVLGALMAFALTEGSLHKVIPHVESLSNVPGRMELVRHWKGAAVYIDYAHTPKGLEQALLTLRDHGQGRIVVVFGCGGERDTTKRGIMGAVAQELADVVVVTDDNPRNEDPEKIRQEIREQCPKAIEIPNRVQAIGWAMDQLNPDDCLLIAGKGHEKVQIVGQHHLFHSDHYCVGSFFEEQESS